MQLGVFEILGRADTISDRNERVQYLRQYAIKPVQQVLQYARDPKIEWLVRGPLPPFSRNIYPGQETLLLAEARRLYLFVKDGHPTLDQRKREVLFVQFLEMLCKEDVIIIDFAKEKQLPYKNLTDDVILEAFPGLYEPAPKEPEQTDDSTDAVNETEETKSTDNEKVSEEIDALVKEKTGDENLDAVKLVMAKAQAKAEKDTKAAKAKPVKKQAKEENPKKESKAEETTSTEETK